MYKNYLIALVLILVVVAAASFFSSNESETLTIEDGVWIETGRDLNKLNISNDKVLLEKINEKNLLFLSQISAGKKNYYFPLVRVEPNSSSQFRPLKLEPFLPCFLTTSWNKLQLIATLSCDNDLKGTITFSKEKDSLFREKPSDSNLTNAEIEQLQKFADIEFSTREIESLKTNIDALSEMTTEGSLKMLVEKFETSIKDSAGATKSLAELESELLTKKKKIEAIKIDKKNLTRSSNYGAEVELASRVNNVEWQISLGRWSDLNLQKNDFNESKTDAEPDLIDNEPSIETNQLPPPPKGDSWWKEF